MPGLVQPEAFQPGVIRIGGLALPGGLHGKPGWAKRRAREMPDDADGRASAAAATTLERPEEEPEAQAWRIEQAFSEGARRWPDRPAVETPGGVLTYAELEARANRLAQRLAADGVGPGNIVGLLCGDVGKFALGALAVLKAGAAYVALDLRYPLMRAPQGLFGDVALLLGARDGPLMQAAAAAGVRVLPQALAPPEGGEEPDPGPPPLHGAAARAPAYLCYTSGTTGQPKGALLPHDGVRGLVSHPQFDAYREGARIASVTTFTFDAVVLEVWGSLLNGCCIVETPVEVVRAPWRIGEFLARQRIDGVVFTTALLNAAATRTPAAFGGLTNLLFGGEAADPAYLRRILESGRPPRRLINVYGPTEATTIATCHEVTPADLARELVPIGRAIAGREVCVLTPDGRTAGPGEDGELCIGGAAVALGYLGAPELTAEKFIPDPASSQPGARLYRTGDLCRLQDDGALQFLGRLDDQVKVRGHRVEPIGVAALLRRIEGVEEAVVLTRPGPFGARQLVAFLRGSGALGEAELHRAAAGVMADYMLPSAFRWVDAYPLKENGKVDAAALLARLEADPLPERETAPGADPEQALIDIWLRNAARPGFDLDTPFDEVCDSLAMVGVLIDIEAAFGRELPLWALAPPVTIRSMRAALEGEAVEGEAVAEEAGPVRVFYVSQPWNMTPAPAPIPAAVAQGEPWQQLQVAPRGGLDPVYDSVEAMAEILEAQVAAAGGEGPYRLVGHSLGGVLALALAARLEQRGARVEHLILLDSSIARRRTKLDRWRVTLTQALLLAVTDPARLGNLLAERMRRALGRETRSRAVQIRARCAAAVTRYAPQPIAAPALLVRCTRYDDVLERPRYSIVTSAPWGPLVGALKVIEIGCTHAEMVREPQLARVAEMLRGLLAP